MECGAQVRLAEPINKAGNRKRPVHPFSYAYKREREARIGCCHYAQQGLVEGSAGYQTRGRLRRNRRNRQRRKQVDPLA
ncbi:MAG: hypothetical protein AMXMBFR4_21960 [Candidatus Hydrogenedentota bacterium]